MVMLVDVIPLVLPGNAFGVLVLRARARHRQKCGRTEYGDYCGRWSERFVLNVLMLSPLGVSAVDTHTP